MLSRKRTIFFDAGFTLLEPRQPVAEVYYAAACSVGAKIVREEFEQRLAAAWPSARAEYRSAYPDLASSDILEREAWRGFTRAVARPFPELCDAEEQWLQLLFDHFDAPAAWRILPRTHETLETLKSRGLRLGVVSNWHSVLHEILSGHDLTGYFDFVITSAEAGHKKPHPAIFRKALELACSDASEVLHIGDSWEEDVEGALGAGIGAVHFCRDRTKDGSVQVAFNATRSTEERNEALRSSTDFVGLERIPASNVPVIGCLSEIVA